MVLAAVDWDVSFVLVASNERTRSGLDGENDLADLLFSLLFNGGKLAGTEEDLGETQAVLFLVDAQLLHQGVNLSLGVRSGSWDVVSDQVVTLQEFGVDDPVGESLTRDTDTLKNTVATELVQNDVSIDIVGSLSVIWNDATNEVWGCGGEGGHQSGQLLLVLTGDSYELCSLLSGLGGGGRRGGALSANIWAWGSVELWHEFLSEEVYKELVLGRFHGEFEIVLEWVLVLFDPAFDFVLDNASVVPEAEVVLGEAWLFEEWVALVVLVELGQ
jgi:hypothetical protein